MERKDFTHLVLKSPDVNLQAFNLVALNKEENIVYMGMPSMWLVTLVAEQ